MDIFYPIKIFADWLTYKIFSIPPDTFLCETVNFFIFDTIKIFILLIVIIFTVSVVRTFFPPEKIRKILSHENEYMGNISAALFGIITPFCSCSAIPLFLGFIEAGVPLGVTFSFIVSSPMINEVALVLLLGMFGLKVALIYAVSGLFIAIISGIIIGQLKVENMIQHITINTVSNSFIANLHLSWKDRFKIAKEYTLSVIGGVWPYILIGVGIGAWLHGYVPSDFLLKYASGNKWYAVPLATLIGIPLYAGCAGVFPLVSVLLEKGLSIGTVLAFMMAVTGLSLPEFMILKKVMKTKLLLIFAGVVGIGIIFTGYLFNLIL